MKSIIFITISFLIIVAIGGILYVGYSYGLKMGKNNASNKVTPQTLQFNPPIPLNNPAIQSAHMEYVLLANLGDVTTKKGNQYLYLYTHDKKLIGSFKLADQVLIYSGKIQGKKLTIQDIKKGTEAQINITYGAYHGIGETNYISYILMK